VVVSILASTVLVKPSTSSGAAFLAIRERDLVMMLRPFLLGQSLCKEMEVSAAS
jgi:hypothetical protein